MTPTLPPVVPTVPVGDPDFWTKLGETTATIGVTVGMEFAMIFAQAFAAKLASKV